MNINTSHRNMLMHLTFELKSVVISDTFWVANPPILMALCVAWEASFDADDENKDHPYNCFILMNNLFYWKYKRLCNSICYVRYKM